MMGYHEAIYCMKVMAEEEVCEECNFYHSCDHSKQADMARVAISAMQELQQYKQLGTLEEVREAVETVKKYEVQYPDDIRNLLEPIKVSSALKSEIMKLEFRKQSKPESISMLDYTIIAALKSVLEHTE